MDPAEATSTFIVRMWPDPVATEQPAWRGSIEDVVRKRRLYFTNLGTMCEFMVDQRRLRVPPEADDDDASDG